MAVLLSLPINVKHTRRPQVCKMCIKPSVSVIIPAYNSRNTISRALTSVLSQTLQPTEIIVIDDGSIDDTVSVVQRFSSQLQPDFLKLVKLDSNHGPGYARNIGWDMACGKFLAFLDADDSWHRRKLEIQTTYMLKHSELTLTGHRCICLSEHDTPPQLPENWDVKPISRRQLMLFSCSLFTPSVIIKRGIPYRFDPGRRYLEDRLLWLQLALNGCKIARLELTLAYLHKAPYGEKGLSSDLWPMEKGELDAYTQLRKMGLLNKLQESALKAFSLLKYLRRVWLSRRRSRVT